jgi:hypothetical protein
VCQRLAVVFGKQGHLSIVLAATHEHLVFLSKSVHTSKKSRALCHE